MAYTSAVVSKEMGEAITRYVYLLDSMVDLEIAARAVQIEYPNLGWRSVQGAFKRLRGVNARTYAAGLRDAYVAKTISAWGDGPDTRAAMAKHIGCGRLTLNSIVHRLRLSNPRDSHRVFFNRRPSIHSDSIGRVEVTVSLVDCNGRLRDSRDILRDLYRG